MCGVVGTVFKWKMGRTRKLFRNVSLFLQQCIHKRAVTTRLCIIKFASWFRFKFSLLDPEKKKKNKRCELTAMLSKGKRAARKLKRAQILLAADAGCSDYFLRTVSHPFLQSGTPSLGRKEGIHRRAKTLPTATRLGKTEN